MCQGTQRSPVWLTCMTHGYVTYPSGLQEHRRKRLSLGPLPSHYCSKEVSFINITEHLVIQCHVLQEGSASLHLGPCWRLTFDNPSDFFKAQHPSLLWPLQTGGPTGGVPSITYCVVWVSCSTSGLYHTQTASRSAPLTFQEFQP